MKKLLYYLPIFVFLTAFTCDNEPLEGEFGTGTGSCPEATQAVVEASVNFINATEENYQTLCSAYKVALENLIDACGDPDGSIQLSIDALGSCTNPSDFDDCEALENASNLAEINFINAPEENYSDFCLAYKFALQNQIEGCGDTGGSLQAIIDDLGNCDNNVGNPNQELSLVAGTLTIDFEDVSVVVEGGVVKVSGVDTSPGSVYSIYFEVPVGATGDDLINTTFELTLTSVFYPSTLGPPFDFVSSITVNESGSLVGTFGGLVSNADGGDLNLSSGVINIIY